MGNTKEENRRVKNAVGNALLKLLRSQRLESISVTQIVETAGVSRMSFYRNFENKTAVLEYCFERLMDEVVDELGEEPQLWSAAYGRVYFQIMEKYREDVLNLHDNGLSGLILNIFNRMNEEIAGDMPYDSIERYNLYFAAGASYNAAIYWLQHGCRESIDELNACICRFMGIKTE